MYSSYLTNSAMDPVLPDLLPEGSFLDDLLYTDVPVPTIPNADIATLNHRLDRLSLDTNTQSLRIDKEKAKRQKLSATVRRVRQDLSSPRPEIVTLQQDVDVIRSEQNSVNYYLEAEIPSNSVMTFRSLSRIYQILALMIPQMTLPSNHTPDLNRLLLELAHTLQQFRVDYTVSYV